MNDGVTMHVVNSYKNLKNYVADRFLRKGPIFCQAF